MVTTHPSAPPVEQPTRRDGRAVRRILLGPVLSLLLLAGAVGYAVAPAPQREAAAAAVAPEASPWQPGEPELGVQILWVRLPVDTPQTVGVKARRVIDHAVGLEANAVTISFPFEAASITADAVGAGADTPTPEELAVLVDEAAARGLRVALRPLLDESEFLAADSRNWRGRLTPRNRAAWFASYQAFLDPYLRMAAGHPVTEFVLGAEFQALEGDPRWAALAQYARDRFPGTIGYDANWDSPAAQRTRLPTDRVRVDAYPILGVADNATTAELTAAWSEWLRRELPAGGAGEVLSEIGIATQPGAFAQPFQYALPGVPLDESVQERWFTAACAAARERGLAGIYWWRLDFHLDLRGADPATDRADSFTGRAGEQAIRRCFSEWGEAR